MTKNEMFERLRSIRMYLKYSALENGCSEYFLTVNNLIISIDDLDIESYDSPKYGKSQYLKLMRDGKLIATVEIHDLVSVS